MQDHNNMATAADADPDRHLRADAISNAAALDPLADGSSDNA